MMNNILFTKKPNKQKNIEKCSHILYTHTTESINHGWLHNSGGKNGVIAL